MCEDSEAGGRITGWDKQMQKKMQKILWALACASPHISLARKGGET
jgi:hypothetical protein